MVMEGAQPNLSCSLWLPILHKTMLGQVHCFTCLTRALRATGGCFHDGTTSWKDGHPSLAHSWEPRGARRTSPGGGDVACSSASFSVALSPLPDP